MAKRKFIEGYAGRWPRLNRPFATPNNTMVFEQTMWMVQTTVLRQVRWRYFIANAGEGLVCMLCAAKLKQQPRRCRPSPGTTEKSPFLS